jgi:NhaP-type Na+/H+ or K+/H+ antiporter
LNLDDLKKVGTACHLMSFVPACIEMTTVGLLGPIFFSPKYNESFLLGSVLGAVSPAVVVPMMVV